MKVQRLLVIAILSGFGFKTFGEWSLPYPQPDIYDYNYYYSNAFNGFMNSGVVKPAERLSKAWEYYKQTYIMSNGLVRHLRMDGDQVIGQNEAVSEGIGYGMLLALINNDQANFNKIFEGANSQMWRGSSYGCWSWKNGGCAEGGAATDADLDIALALVFADKLQENRFWSSYNKSGVTYKSRALELIGGIKTTMTNGDVLLPGDSWDGDGFNNINPSYFSVAAMRVFNDYQTTHDFTNVIKKCYSILEATSNYSKGQAPDWCNTSGGSVGKNYGMSIEAIRVPWRIGLDAIWFNDTRAISYCKNTKKTLTSYTSDDVFDQMIEYKADGTPDMADPNRQKDNFERVAMWCTAVLGSKDTSYTKSVFCDDVDYYITGGDELDYFGSFDSDQHFYYKQSLGMLGYATIFGLFPNVLADMENIPKIDTVHISTGLKVSSTSVILPDTITFTAKFDKAADWQLIITGQTSGKSDTMRDSSSQISEEWFGDGWFTKETVKATLTVENLATNTSSTMVNTQFTIIDIVPILKKTNQHAKSQFYSIYQISHGLVINAGDKLLPVLNIYKLNGERVLSHKFNMNTRYADNHFIPVTAARMTSGQYIAQLSDEDGSTPAMVRRFIWR